MIDGRSLAWAPGTHASDFLTLDEEATLLSEYGVKGPYDGLLDIPAESRFPLQYGDGNVFVTGQGDFGAMEAQTGLDEDALGWPSQNQLLHYPISLLACRYTYSFNNKAPTCLMEKISNTLEGLEATECCDPGVASLSLNDLSELPPLEPMDEFAKEHADLAEADRLIQQADAFMKKPTPVTQHMDPYLQDLKAQLAQEEELARVGNTGTYPSNIEFPTEDECCELLRHSKTLRKGASDWKKLKTEDDTPSTLASALDEPLKTTSTCEDEPLGKQERRSSRASSLSRHSLTSQVMLPKLFAFEFGASLEHAEEMKEWGTLLEKCEAHHTERVEAHASLYQVNALFSTKEQSVLVSPRDSVLVMEELAMEKVALPERPASKSLKDRPFLQEVKTLDVSLAEPVAMDAKISEHSEVESPQEPTVILYNHSPRRALNMESQPHGRIAMNSFIDLLDRLLPPASAELAIQKTVLGNSTTLIEKDMGILSEGGSLSALVHPAQEDALEETELTQADAIASLSSIHKKAKLESMMVECEAREARLMRKEDMRIDRLLLNTHLLQQRIRTQMEKTLEEAEKAFEAVTEEEFHSFEKLRCSEQDSRRKAVKIGEARRNREIQRRATEMMQELTDAQNQIEALYEAEFLHLAQEKARDLSAVQESLHSKLNPQLSTLASQGLPAPNATPSSGAGGDETMSLFGLVPPPVSLSRDMSVERGLFFAPETLREVEDLRLEMLQTEYEARSEWLRARTAELSHLAGQLSEEMNLRRRDACHSTINSLTVPMSVRASGRQTSVSHAISERTVASRDCHNVSDDKEATSSLFVDSASSSRPLTILNAEMFRKVQAALFLGCDGPPTDVARRFYALSFSLESIETVDWKSLRSVHLGPQAIRPSSRHVGGRHCGQFAQRSWADCGSVCDWVRDLDLGSNDFEVIPLSDVIDTFPSLRRLKLSDNHISVLDLKSQSKDSLSRSASIRSIATAQQNAVSERTRLSELNLSSNNLEDLNSLPKYLSHSITRLCAFANRLVSVEPLRSCVRLTKVELNRNFLSNIEPLESLQLLQELNLCDNNLTHIAALSKGSWPLLEKLYISNNALVSLRFPQVEMPDTRTNPHCLFLTQLFVNHNRFTAFTENELPWMPMLSVLQAEGNQLHDISGLTRCPRLTSVKLAFNRLERLISLKALGVCRFLTSLDIRANPLMSFLVLTSDNRRDNVVTDGDGRPVFDEHSVIPLFRRMFPLLREFNTNSEPLTASSKVSTDAPMDPVAQVDPRRRFSRVERALSADMFFMDIRARRETLFVMHRRRFHGAISAEKRMYAAIKSSPPQQMPRIDYLSSLTIEEEQQLDMFEFVQKALKALLESVRIDFDGDYSHLLNQIPDACARANEVRQSRARGRLARWILQVALRRRAKRKLQQQKEARQAEEVQGRDRAARRIQSVWRGAALRSRLKRILFAPHDDLGGDEQCFTKVDPLTLPQECTLEVNGLGDIIRQTVREDICLIPRFDIDLTKATKFDLEPTSLKISRASGSVLLDKRQPGTLPGLGSDVCELKESTAPRVEPSQSPDTSSGWDPSVSLQIEKKRKKMKLVHQQHVHEEYMRNPLKFKQKLHQGSTKKSV